MDNKLVTLRGALLTPFLPTIRRWSLENQHEATFATPEGLSTLNITLCVGKQTIDLPLVEDVKPSTTAEVTGYFKKSGPFKADSIDIFRFYVVNIKVSHDPEMTYPININGTVHRAPKPHFHPHPSSKMEVLIQTSDPKKVHSVFLTEALTTSLKLGDKVRVEGYLKRSRHYDRLDIHATAISALT